MPDLATAIPEPTDGGKTYTFTLRKGITYSDGTPLKASDFVTVMKRQFTVPGPTSFYTGLVGADACAKNPKTCDLSQGVVADDSAGTVTFHLVAPDPEFLFKLSLPFAFARAGEHQPQADRRRLPPGTGPYMWKSYDPDKEAVLVRNPHFKLWSADAQPEGNPDQIVEKFGLSVEDEVTAVENGDADMVFDQDGIPADRLNEIDTKYASQAHVNQLTADYYMAINVRVPPFNNKLARQAVNYAVDRQAMVKIYGGPSLATASCQVLPPGFPGYEQYCPYTANPAPNGAGPWTAPDVAKAKQLVQQSGTAGASVSVVGTTDTVGKSLTLQLVNDLNAIGYKATAKLLGRARGIDRAFRTRATRSRSGTRSGSRTTQRLRTSSTFCSDAATSGRTAMPPRTSPSSVTRRSRPRWTRPRPPVSPTRMPPINSGRQSTMT